MKTSYLILVLFSLVCNANNKIVLFYKDLIDVCIISGAEIGALFIQPGNMVFDVGAHNGGWIDHAMRYKNFSAYLFEPVPTLFDIIQKKYANNPKINCYQFAMHNYVGEANFHINLTKEGKNTEGSSLFLTYTTLKDILIKVVTNTIDNFCDQHNIHHIHFLKIDAESADPYVIYGASNMISNHQIDFIQFEFSRGGYEISQVNFENLYQFLRAKGYIIFYIDDRQLLLQKDNSPSVNHGDFLAVNKHLLDNLKIGTPKNNDTIEEIKNLYSQELKSI